MFRVFLYITIIIIGIFVIPFSPVHSSHTFWRELATFLTLVLRESLAIFLFLCKSLKVIDISVKKQITLIYLFNNSYECVLSVCMRVFVCSVNDKMIDDTSDVNTTRHNVWWYISFAFFSARKNSRSFFFLSFCLFLSLFIAIIV